MLIAAGTLIGGLGVFLLAITMITDGLKLAAGDKLKGILERWTTTRLRAVGSGVLVTAIVQSSSAVTVATIGFVNAGLLTLGRALGVIYGANVGTTMTGWIVAAVGFSFHVEALALPMVGVGMFTRLLRQNTRIGELGMAVAGFGLFFLGIDLMRDAFELFASDLDFAGIAPQGGFGLVLYVLLGILMTIATQSSSAAIAITLTAATGGVLTIDSAAATVIGANVGTTSTAAFAVIGATANARRVAAAHVIFNFATGAVALLLLPLMLWIVRVTGSFLGLADIPAVSLALFHTVFNVLGVALMWPFTTRLTGFLRGRFTTQAERFSRPQFLDQNVMATPALAIEALSLELARAAGLTRDLVRLSLSSEGPRERGWRERHAGLEALDNEITSFVANLEVTKLPEALKGNIPVALRVLGYLEEVLGLLEDYETHRPDVEAISHSGVGNAIAAFSAAVVAHLGRCEPRSDDGSAPTLRDGYSDLRDQWKSLKSIMLEAASRREVGLGRLNSALEGIRISLRIAEQLTKGAERLRTLTASPRPPERPVRVGAPEPVASAGSPVPAGAEEPVVSAGSPVPAGAEEPVVSPERPVPAGAEEPVVPPGSPAPPVAEPVEPDESSDPSHADPSPAGLPPRI